MTFSAIKTRSCIASLLSGFALTAMLMIWLASPLAAQTEQTASDSTQTLIELLKDDTARAALISDLERSVEAANAAPEASEAPRRRKSCR